MSMGDLHCVRTMVASILLIRWGEPTAAKIYTKAICLSPYDSRFEAIALATWHLAARVLRINGVGD